MRDIKEIFPFLKLFKMKADDSGNVWGQGTKPVIFTGTALTLTTEHSGCVIRCTSDDPVTITLPDLPAGFGVLVIQAGLGGLEFISVLDIENADGLTTTNKRYAAVSVYKSTDTSWWLDGRMGE